MNSIQGEKDRHTHRERRKTFFTILLPTSSMVFGLFFPSRTRAYVWSISTDQADFLQEDPSSSYTYIVQLLYVCTAG